MSEPTDEIDETMFPKRMRFFRRDRKMTMGDHLLYAPEDWRMYIREDTVKTAALEAEIARLRARLALLEQPVRPIPEPYLPPQSSCPRCGIAWDRATGYVCTDRNCPRGLAWS